MADMTFAPPPSHSARTSLVLGTIGHGVNDAYTAFLPALLPMFHLELGLDETTLAGVVAIFALSASLPGPLLGKLSDRIGEAPLTAASVLFSAVLLSFLVAVPSTPLLFALVAVAGFGSAAIHPAGSMLVRRGASRPEFAVALFAAGGMLGYAAGPTLLAVAREYAGPALPFILVLPGIVAAATIMALAPFGSTQPRPALTKATRFDWSLVFGPVGLLTLAAALAFLPATAVLFGLPLFLMEHHGLLDTHPTVAGTLSTFSLAAAAGGICVGFLAGSLSRTWLLCAVLTGSVPAFLALLWLAPDAAGYSIVLGVAGALSYAATPILVVAAQDLAPRSGATASGMVFGLGSALAGIMYFGIGTLQAEVGVGLALSLAFAAPLLSAAISFAALRHIPFVAAASVAETLCACAAASGTGIVTRAPSRIFSCNGVFQNA